VLIERARQGDVLAHRAVRDVANRLGVGLAGLINVLGPDRVVLVGLLGDYLALTGDELRAQLQTSIVARLHKTELVAATVAHPVLLGAAEHILKPLLQDPSGLMTKSEKQ
jgi:predicted NBD/HSP70 family sugar kinase